MRLYKDNYIAGAYKRKHTKGYFQFLRYNYGTVKIDRAKGNEVFVDYAIDDALNKNIINNNLYHLYYNKLKDYFRDFTCLEDNTDEEIYGDLCTIRQEVFGQIFEDDRFDYSIIPKHNTKELVFEEYILDVIYGEISQEKRSHTSPINQMELLKESIKNNDKLIFLVGNRGQLYSLIRILDKDIQIFRNKKIILFLKSKRIYDEATIDDYNDIIKNYSNNGLSSSMMEHNVEIRSYKSQSAGLNFSDLEEKDGSIFEDACHQKAVVIGLGELNLFSLKNVNFDYFILTPIQRIVASRYTNIYRNGSNSIPYMISYVLKEYECDEDFTGNERLSMSLYHYNCLLNNFGINTCRHFLSSNQDISKILPNLYMNFYSTTLKEKSFPEFVIEDYSNREDYIRKKRELLHSFINNNFNGKYISCYYNADEIGKINYDNYKEKNNSVLVTGLLFNDSTALNVIEAEKINKSAISPREYARSEELKGLTFYSNFLYFVTENIKETYNYTRENQSMEKINVDKIFLGYKYLNSTSSSREEYFPLYNKGYMGYTKSGQVFFGRRTLLGGKIIINTKEISWDSENVNTSHGDVSIFTPYIDNDRLSTYSDNFRNFHYLCGNERLNLVIINNKIVCVRYGQVAIPSIGVVVSVIGDSIQALKEVMGLRMAEDGYYEVTKPYTLKVYLEKPNSLTQEDWNDVLWAYGGATLLVENGINLVENKEKQIEAFRNEGWFHPLSKQTQETQVQDWVRGPRTVVGLTADNKFFVFVFSGRTKESCGANFNEIVKILEKEIGDICWAMNLDGGASSSLSMVYRNELIELSYPCVSDLSSAGMVRPINSMLIMK